MFRPHPKRARTIPTHPAAWGTCDRSGFVGNHRDLSWQYEYAGTQLINKRLLVLPSMLDKPQRQLGTIILPPDPVSILNSRPEPYPVDEYWDFMWEAPNPNRLIQMEGSEATITYESGQYYNTVYVAPGPPT